MGYVETIGSGLNPLTIIMTKEQYPSWFYCEAFFRDNCNFAAVVAATAAAAAERKRGNLTE